MATSFLGLAEEQHRRYVMKSSEAAPAEIRIAGIEKIAKKIVNAPGESIETLKPAKPSERQIRDDTEPAPT